MVFITFVNSIIAYWEVFFNIIMASFFISGVALLFSEVTLRIIFQKENNLAYKPLLSLFILVESKDTIRCEKTINFMGIKQ